MAVFVADEQGSAVDVDRLRRLSEHVLVAERVPTTMELNVLCVDAASMAELNVHHMGGSGATDVLAFPMDLPGEAIAGEPAILGDVVLCPEVAAAQAAEHGTTGAAELDLLVVHGILHLLGHDHAEPQDRDRMFGRTRELLARFATAAGAGTADRSGA
ncbi:MAG: rRNA maturation RNase YbeY [Euzebyales bacterium]|nr:rRNA maturation RNase YbeY [Euzebyales bacterium]